MTKQLEMKQKLNELYDYLVAEYERSGIMPSVRDICRRFDIRSTATASSYLRKLEEMGMIEVVGKKSRFIQLVAYKRLIASDFAMVPLIGEVSAGPGLLAQENHIDTFRIPYSILQTTSGDLFMLQVEGSSMIDIGIMHGDYIIVRHQPSAENGQVVVALLDGENATVKRFYNENGVVRLHPENSDMRDIFPQQVDILGLVVGLYRKAIV